MTLAPPGSSDLAAVLLRGVEALNHQTSPGQRALQSGDELSCAMRHLLVTAKTAGKLADVAVAAAQQGAAGADTERIRAETERFRAEAEKVGREAERATQERLRLNAEAEKVAKETEKLCKEMERATLETLGRKAEGEKVGKEVEMEKAVAKVVKNRIRKRRLPTPMREDTAPHGNYDEWS